MHGQRKSQCKECGGSGICMHGRRKSRCKECGGTQRTRKPKKAAVQSSSSDPDTADEGDDDNGKGDGEEERNYVPALLRRRPAKAAPPMQAAMPNGEVQLDTVGEGLDLHSEDEVGSGAAPWTKSVVIGRRWL